MTAAGLHFEGFWPASRKQLVRVSERIMDPDEQAQTSRFGSDVTCAQGALPGTPSAP